MSNKSETYKILSLNLAGYRDWAERREPITRYIDFSKPDIILFQEVHFDQSISPFDQAITINNMLVEPYKFCHSSVSRPYVGRDGQPHREGLASLSRLPVLGTETLALTKRPDDKHLRIFQAITIQTTASPLSIVNVHFSNNSYAAEQLEELYTIVDRYDQPPIIVGDFNIFKLSDHRELYAAQHTPSTDFKQYVSFPGQKLTLDYLLLPKSFEFQEIETQDSLSDHSAILYTLKHL